MFINFFANFLGKHLCWSLFLIKPLKKETPTLVFSCETCEIFKDTYFEEHLRTTTSMTAANMLNYMIVTRSGNISFPFLSLSYDYDYMGLFIKAKISGVQDAKLYLPH